MYLTAGLHRSVQRHPDKTATVHHGRRQTFLELRNRVARLAGGLQQRDVAPGDRVAILALNSDRYIEAALAVWWAGALLNPINTRWSRAEIAYGLKDCAAGVLLVDDAFAPLAQDLAAQVPSLRTMVHLGEQPSPADLIAYDHLLTQAEPIEDARCDAAALAAILYTGGTTGFPKGVMLSHRNLWSSMVGRMAEVPNPGDFATLLTAPCSMSQAWGG